MQSIDMSASAIPLSERVYQALKKSIVRGDLHPGYRLIIVDIANAYGVSQAPVREAIERLKHEGLLVGEPNKGSIVAHVSARDMEEVYELREALEGYILERLIPQIKSTDIEHLRTLHEEMVRAAEADDLFGLIELDMQFHSWFYEAYGNKQILATWRAIQEKTSRFISITNQLYYANLQVIAERHLPLIDVLGTKDIGVIMGVYLRHIREVWGRMDARW